MCIRDRGWALPRATEALAREIAQDLRDKAQTASRSTSASVSGASAPSRTAFTPSSAPLSEFGAGVHNCPASGSA
eukprot:7451641-Alexandrium_andersonii.AAC.1